MSSSSDGLAGMPFGGPSASDKLELARKLAQRINLQHNIGKEAKGASQQAAEFILKGGAAMQPTISAKTVAEQVLYIDLYCFHVQIISTNRMQYFINLECDLFNFSSISGLITELCHNLLIYLY